VLTHRGELLDALYHAACGGTTAELFGVFGRRAQAPLQSVRCAGCTRENAERAGQPSWSWTASPARLGELARSLNLGERIVALQPVRSDEHGRWLEVELVGTSGRQRISARDLRTQLGSTDLKSARILGTWPPVGRPIHQGMLFEGIGRGHGVGLCQTGALAMAREGAGARQILAHYYPGAVLIDWRSLPGAQP
jgi:stage II sporulation protein D